MSTTPILDSSPDPAGDGGRLIQQWVVAQKDFQNAQIALNKADDNARKAKEALAKWMVPSDAVAGEKFCILYSNDEMIQVEVPLQPHMPAKVTIRKRGKAAE